MDNVELNEQANVTEEIKTDDELKGAIEATLSKIRNVQLVI